MSMTWVVLAALACMVAAAPQVPLVREDGSPSEMRSVRFFGPFPIGKTEVDADPVLAAGGHAALASDARLQSELADGGLAGWSTFHAPSAGGPIVIEPVGVRWRELYEQLRTPAVLEFQGWMLGRFRLSSAGAVLVSCTGITGFAVDGVWAEGDLYNTQHHASAFNLSAGVHALSARVRGTTQARVRCLVRRASSQQATALVFSPLSPLPDLARGAGPLARRARAAPLLLALPLTNASPHAAIDAAALTVHLHGGATLRLLDEPLLPPGAVVLPGATALLRLALQQHAPCMQDETGLRIAVLLGGVELGASPVFGLTCRDLDGSQSYLFSFDDHDGSVGVAAVIAPRSAELAADAPVLMTLHGMGVAVRDSADAFKRSSGTSGAPLVFGVEGFWLLAPTRHGAHNWQYTGAWTARRALAVLRERFGAARDAVLYAGHSMGGHGAWLQAALWPRDAIGVFAAAGWLVKESYGDSNLVLALDLAADHVDARLRGVLLSAVDDAHSALHAPNIAAADVPVLGRVGADDATVSPWFTRRMVRLLTELGANATLDEVPGMAHWWWDSVTANDGGAVNDARARAFFASCLQRARSPRQSRHWFEAPATALRVAHAAACPTGVRGVRVLEQRIPGQRSDVRLQRLAGAALEYRLEVTNCVRIALARPPPGTLAARVLWDERSDAALLIEPRPAVAGACEAVTGDKRGIGGGDDENEEAAQLCLATGGWALCPDAAPPRGLSLLGPLRRVYARPFAIIFGSQCTEPLCAALRDLAVLLGDWHLMTTHTRVVLLPDTGALEARSAAWLHSYNLVFVGGAQHNAAAAAWLRGGAAPIELSTNGVSALASDGARVRLARNASGLALVTLAATVHAGQLAMVLDANDAHGVALLRLLGSPTVPPMARAPFTNLFPDWLVARYDDVVARGQGGYSAAGWFDGAWRVAREASYGLDDVPG